MKATCNFTEKYLLWAKKYVAFSFLCRIFATEIRIIWNDTKIRINY